ncbi:MAG: glycosyl transferase family 4/glycosyltransferase, group 1 family [Treponematales bacterium]
MKKLLLITAFPPNNRSGGQKFTLDLIRDLAGKYTIDVVYFTYPGHEAENGLPVRSVKAFDAAYTNCLRKPHLHPLFTRRFNKKILAYLRSIASGYDILYFDYIQTGLYALYIDHPYKILRDHDVLYQKYGRRSWLLKRWVMSTEGAILRGVKRVFVPSEKDAEIVSRVYHTNAISTHEYMKDFVFYDTAIESNTIMFFGLWSRKENLEGLLWFMRKVYPLLNESVRIVVIGGGLPPACQNKFFQTDGRASYLGFVDDPLLILYRSRALAAPLFHGAGVKVKVIDAFTTGTPVVGTDITFEGIPYVEGLQIKADTPREYAAAINGFAALSCAQKQGYAARFRRVYDNNHLADFL